MQYRWATSGDLNAFFALFLDNIVNLVLLASFMINIFGFPENVIYTYMIPGTALGVMFGDLVYTWMAFRLAKRDGRQVTAMPLGLDTPSTIGMVFAVLGPAFLYFKFTKGMDEQAAAMLTWKVGMATMIWMAVVKTVTSFFGETIQRIVPTAGLLGSLAGIGLVWLAADSLIHIYEIPFVGLISLIIIIFTLMAHFQFPLKLPGAAAAVVLGSLVYYGLLYAGFLDSGRYKVPEFKGLALLLPLPTMAAFDELFGEALAFLPVAIPFGLLTIVGGINVTEGARLVGDRYKTRSILLTEAAATFLAGLCGGVSQSTPYIGHSAYKKMGARAAYTLFTGLAVGLGGMFGLVGFIVSLIPKAAVAPLLVFVGFEIMTLAFTHSPRKHAMAVVFAIVPSILNYGYIKLKLLLPGVSMTVSRLTTEMQNAAAEGQVVAQSWITTLQQLIPHTVAEEYVLLGALGQGFILTAMIWGACVAFVLDGRIWQAAVSLGVAAVFSFFGLIHSVMPNGDLYWPFQLADISARMLKETGVGLHERALHIPFEFTAAYLLIAVSLPLMYFLKPRGSGQAEEEPLVSVPE